MKSTLETSALSFKPSKRLNKYLSSTKLASIHLKEPVSVLTSDDYSFLKTLDLQEVSLTPSHDDPTVLNKGKVLNLQDVLQIWDQLKLENSGSYLHELLSDTAIILPQNPNVPRSAELEKRCKLLKIQQENREYKLMTKSVDSVRKTHPEDTIAYQLKQMNRQLIGVLQFIISVIVGFVFGFIGIEMMVGTLDIGFRLLLGITCSLIIGVAELYFLAKKLNE